MITGDVEEEPPSGSADNFSSENFTAELEDYVLDIDKALDVCGKIGGVCYNKEGFDALLHEDTTKTQKRIKMTIENGHHSVYDHIYIGFNIIR